MSRDHILAIDQGTTSTRIVVFDRAGGEAGSAAAELPQHYPQPGWVEHDPEDIWRAVVELTPAVLAKCRLTADRIAAIGLTNQRETTLLWNRQTGGAVARAIVWQDRRTADFCRRYRESEEWLRERTGLVLDPYFSATKIRWMLDNLTGVRAEADAGKLAFGTIDSFLIWRLTGGRTHATDVTNASRTLLLNLRAAAWDAELCQFFQIPSGLLPDVRPSAGSFGATHGLGFLPDGIPIGGVAGDQQAALFGQRCFEAGEAKCTYGTGAFFLLHSGPQPMISRRRLVSTLAATTDRQPRYALEGSVFIAGAAVQWLRDGLKLMSNSADVEALARQASADEEVVLVPALVGLGAPHWQPEARGTIFGVTRATTAADFARAALEGVACQVVDLVAAAEQDNPQPLRELRVDGGMARNDYFVQLQADLLGRPILRSPSTEATVLGAALLAGLHAEFWPDVESLRRLPRHEDRFEPRMTEAERQKRLARWRRAVATTIAHYSLANLPPNKVD
jgi:glycerol kinase